MPTYRLTHPDGRTELLEADKARFEGVHTTFRGMVLVMGIPREIVVRRAPRNVLVEQVEEDLQAGERPSWAVR